MVDPQVNSPSPELGGHPDPTDALDTAIGAERQAAGRERPHVYQSIPGLELTEQNLCRELEAREVRQRQLRARLYLVREERRSRRMTALGQDNATGDTLQPEATPDPGRTSVSEGASLPAREEVERSETDRRQVGFSGKIGPTMEKPRNTAPDVRDWYPNW